MRIFGLFSGFSGVFSLQPILFRNFLLDLLPIFLFDLLSILLDLVPKYSSPPFSFSRFELLPIFLDHFPPSFCHRLSSPPSPRKFFPAIFRSNLSFPSPYRILRHFFTFFANYLLFIIKSRV